MNNGVLDLEYYFKKNYQDEAINIYSLKGNIEISKQVIASNILERGIQLTNNKIADVINPKGLVKDIRRIDDVITKKAYYHEKDICNIIIGTPQVIALKDKSYYIGYPRDNVTGYTNASYQKDYDCLLTDFLEKEKGIAKEMIIGYYYEDIDGNKYFKENKRHYSKMNKKDQEDFFSKIIEKMDEKITIGSNKKELLEYIENTIKEDLTDNNSMYQTSLEYLEYQNSSFENIEFNKKEFIDLVKDQYKDYALYIHGVDQNPKFSKITVDFILRSCLHIDEEYGFAGTCEPKGPVNEISSLEEALDYHYGDNHEESYNIIILTPKVLEDMNHDAYFVGYSRQNKTGTFPKSMPDFDCVLTDIVNEMGYVPIEFIFGYQVYGPKGEDKFYLNPKHYSFLSDDLKCVFGTKFLNTKNFKLRDNIKMFIDSYADDDLIYSYANPLIKTKRLSAMQTTAEEYFEFLESKKEEHIIEKKFKGMIK